MNLYRQGAFGDPATIQARLTYWRNMERAHYPFAHAMVEETEQQYKDELNSANQQIAALSEEVSARKEYEAYLQGGNV